MARAAIIEGFVLVGTVGGMVELLARYAFGDKSAFYRSVIMEQVRCPLVVVDSAHLALRITHHP
jgi:hypothetical protein